MTRCCFDKRVWIGLGVLAVGLLIIDPHAGWAALPVLAGLAGHQACQPGNSRPPHGCAAVGWPQLSRNARSSRSGSTNSRKSV